MRSLICSCFCPEPQNNTYTYDDIEVKQINKHVTGQAFKLILQPSSPISEASQTLGSPEKKDLSLEEIQKKMEAAEERRKSQETQVLKQLSDKRAQSCRRLCRKTTKQQNGRVKADPDNGTN